LSLSPAPIQVAPNTEFTATLRLDNVPDVFSISPLRIKFDPALVRLSDVTAGDFMGAVTLEKDIRNDSGDATLTFARAPGSRGVSGSGVLATLKFMAVAAGAGSISITEAQVKNSQLQAVPAAVGSVPVTVR
jgi:general secretion pathway protein D